MTRNVALQPRRGDARTREINIAPDRCNLLADTREQSRLARSLFARRAQQCAQLSLYALRSVEKFTCSVVVFRYFVKYSQCLG